MDILSQVVSGMTKEQVRYFKMFMAGSGTGSRKDLTLFDYIRKHEGGYDDEKIFRKIYPGESKNSYYRLKNRLLRDLACSLSVQHFDEDELVHALHLLALVRFYFSRNHMRLAHYYLRKAEQEALRIESLELLDFIYSEYIKLSHEMVSINPEVYIKRRLENQEKMKQLRAMDDVLAMVSYRMKITQNFSAGANPVIRLLEKTMKEFSAGKSLVTSPALRFRMYHAVSQVLLQKRDYKALAEYLLEVYAGFESEKLFSRSNHDTRLQMLTYMVNALFKSGRYRESLAYAERLMQAMNEYQRLHYDKYIFFYYNSLVINYSRSDRDKAIAILEEMKQNSKIRSSPFYEMFIYLNLAVVFFDKQDYHRSIRNLSRLYMLEGYKEADASLQFKIALAEIMIRYELRDFDLLEYKLKQLKKDFRLLLTRKENQREQDLLEVIKALMNEESLRESKAAMRSARRIIQGTESSDSEVLNYSNWLRDKVKLQR
jgi:hypothetical protein